MSCGLYYFIKLGLHLDCSKNNVEKKYRNISLKVHPDKSRALSIVAELKIKIFILFEKPNENDIKEVEENNCIIFEYDQKEMLWILHACRTENDFTKETPLSCYKVFISKENTSILDEFNNNKISETRKELSGSTRQQLLDFASIYGRKTLYEAQAERFLHLNNTHEMLIDEDMRSIYSTAYIAIDALTEQLISKVSLVELSKKSTICKAIQQIKFLVSKILDDTLLVLYKSKKVTAVSVNEFLKGWIGLLNNVSYYVFFVNKEIEKKLYPEQIITFFDEITKLIFETYLAYVNNKIDIEIFTKGDFILSILISSLVKNTSYLTKYLRFNKEMYELNKITELNSFQINMIQASMPDLNIESGMPVKKKLMGINTMVLCLALAELPLKDEYLLHELLKPIMEPAHYNFIKLLFIKEELSTSTDIATTCKDKKSQDLLLKTQKIQHLRLLKSLCVPKNLDDEEKKNFLINENHFNKTIKPDETNQKKMYEIFERSHHKGKKLMIDYLFYEKKKLSNLIKDCYQTVLYCPDIVDLGNIRNIKLKICYLENKFFILLINIVFVLLKKYIVSSCFNQYEFMEKDSNLYLENLLWEGFSKHSNEINSILNNAIRVNYNTEYHATRKFLIIFSNYISTINELNLDSLNDVIEMLHDDKTIQTQSFLYMQLRAIEFLRQIHCVLMLDGITRVAPREKLCVEDFESLSDTLNNYLDNLVNQKRTYDAQRQNKPVLKNETKTFNNICEKSSELINKSRHFYIRIQRTMAKNMTIHLLTSWENDYKDILHEYKKIRSDIYCSPYINILHSVCVMDIHDKKQLYILCKKYWSAKEDIAINSLLNLLEYNTHALEVREIIFENRHKQTYLENLDCHDLSADQIRSLASCLFALQQLKIFELLLDRYQLNKTITQLKTNYHKKQYDEYFQKYKKWINYVITAYQMLQNSLIEIKENECLIKTKLSNLNCRKLSDSLDYNISCITKNIKSSNKKIKIINETMDASHKLLQLLENAFLKLDHLLLEINSSIKNTDIRKDKDMSFVDCLKLKNEKLNDLAISANTDVNEIKITDELPTKENLNAIKNQLKLNLEQAKKYSYELSVIKIEVENNHHSLLKKKEIFKKNASEKQSLLNELKKQHVEVLYLYNHFLQLFDDAIITSSEAVIDEMLVKINSLRDELKNKNHANFIVKLKEKILKISFLKNKLYQLGESLEDFTYNPDEEIVFVDARFKAWSETLRTCLDNYIHLLLERSHALLANLAEINIEEMDNGISMSRKIQTLSKSADSITFRYHNILKLVSLYKKIGVTINFDERELWNLYNTISANVEGIATIIDVLKQESKCHKKINTQTVVSEGPVQQVTDKQKSPSKTARKARRGRAFSLVYTYQEKFKNLGLQIVDTSRKLLGLKLEADRSKNTIRTILPKVPMDNGRVGLGNILKRKMLDLGNQIRSFAKVIDDLRLEGTVLVRDSLEKLNSFFDLEIKNEIQKICSVMASQECADLSLIELDKKSYKLIMQTKFGKQLTFKLAMNKTPPKNDIELLRIAVTGFSNLLDRNWYLNQTDFIVNKIEKFLCLIASSDRASNAVFTENPYYKEFFERIIKTIEQAKQKIFSFNSFADNTGCYQQKNHELNELKEVSTDLEMKLSFLINSFQDEPLLYHDLEQNHIFEIRTMLLDLITEKTHALYSFVSTVPSLQYADQYVNSFMYDPGSNLFAMLPYPQNHAGFFTTQAVNSSPISYQAVAVAPALCRV